ncbi:MAG: M1 family metallopeptidase [Promethearchaeota archaeon]
MPSIENLRMKYLKRGEFASPDVDRQYAPSLELEPIHQNIVLNFNLDAHFARGYVETQLKAKSRDARIIEYDAIDLTIESVEGPDSWHYNGTKLTCVWSEPIPLGETCKTKVLYSADHPISGLYFSYPDEEYPQRPKYVVSDNESIRARYWLPCVDHLSVRCRLDFHLTGAQNHTILANGALISEENNEDGTKTAHWQLDFPCPSYLITLAVGEFIEFKDRDADGGKGPIPVRYYTSKNFTVEDLGESFSGTPDFIEWMWKKLGCTLEWPKYYQIATARHAGAMENISLVTWGDYAIMDERERKEFKWLVDWINVHEMSHSWFGDMLVCSEFSHAWLKESWATYVEKLWYEDFFGADAYLYGMYEDRRDYMQESDEKYARPIVTNEYDSSWDMYDHHLYPGGSFRIHMLRQMLGDKVFFAAVSDYLNTFKGKTVETIDFQRKLEQHSGVNLQPFFEQWLYAAGYPQLKGKFNYDDKNKLAMVSITQTQVDDKHKIGIFKLPSLVIEWESEEGKMNRQTYQLTEKEHTFYFQCKKKPLQIRIDPGFQTLFSLEFNPGEDLLKRQLQKSDTIGKIFAAVELGKTGSSKNLDAISTQYIAETFWGLKVEFLKALLSSNNYHGMELVTDLIKDEKDSKVLMHIIPKLKGKRQPIVVEMLKEFIQRPDYYYHSTGAALKALGSQRTEEMFTYLTSTSFPADYRGIIEGSLYEAIGQLRTPSAIEYLQEKIPYGNVSEPAKNQLIMSFGEVLQWADKNVRASVLERLFSEMQKEHEELHLMRYIFALRQLNIPEVIPLISAVKLRTSSQFYPRMKKMIKALGKEKTSEESVKKFEKKVEKLEEQVGKLLSRIEILEEIKKN